MGMEGAEAWNDRCWSREMYVEDICISYVEYILKTCFIYLHVPYA